MLFHAFVSIQSKTGLYFSCLHLVVASRLFWSHQINAGFSFLFYSFSDCHAILSSPRDSNSPIWGASWLPLIVEYLLSCCVISAEHTSPSSHSSCKNPSMPERRHTSPSGVLPSAWPAAPGLSSVRNQYWTWTLAWASRECGEYKV